MSKRIIKKGKNTYIEEKDGTLYRLNTYGRQQIMAKHRKQAEELTDEEIGQL